jgi:hypothetical protein
MVTGGRGGLLGAYELGRTPKKRSFGKAKQVPSCRGPAWLQSAQVLAHELPDTPSFFNLKMLRFSSEDRSLFLSIPSSPWICCKVVRTCLRNRAPHPHGEEERSSPTSNLSPMQSSGDEKAGPSDGAGSEGDDNGAASLTRFYCQATAVPSPCHCSARRLRAHPWAGP